MQALEAKVVELTQQLATKDKQLATKAKQLAAKAKEAQSAAAAHRVELAEAQREEARLSVALEKSQQEHSFEDLVGDLADRLAAKDEELASKAEEAQSAASAHKEELAKVQQEAARLPAALSELQEERAKGAKLHAFAATQTHK